ncbi:hypothetical protein TNIN_437571 [Trichonephila inaurata madagascariensis]|uniref:Uncharacterized protein n=1 Tax=Trichonephila inaurata madagascariensis TaxID=2747483 RepID=A0A8X6XND7_9ARAC|nr:hypothetical protein TNIN_437571 [Trichonephila inaurata madagascariensis]
MFVTHLLCSIWVRAPRSIPSNYLTILQHVQDSIDVFISTGIISLRFVSSFYLREGPRIFAQKNSLSSRPMTDRMYNCDTDLVADPVLPHLQNVYTA